MIFFERSPLATAVVTSAMLRTCEVRLVAMALTESVRSFHVPATPRTSAWPPSLPSVPTSRATRVTSPANELSWSTIVFRVFLSSRISPFTSTVIFLERSPLATAVATLAILRTWLVRFDAIELTLSVKSFHVPATPGTWPDRPGAFGADLAGDAAHLAGETVQLVDHGVDRVLELEDLAAHGDRDLLGQVAVGDGGRDLGDVTNLRGQVGRHGVDRVRQVFPGAGHAADLGLAAQLAFGADLARHAGDLAGERVELVDHGVDRVFQLENLAADVDGDLLGEVAVGDGGRDFGDIADLAIGINRSDGGAGKA